MDDLKYLKRHYGEEFMRYCRESFPTILQEEGVLTQLITNAFAPSHSLIQDISGFKIEFTDYILNMYEKFIGEEESSETNSEKTPKELMREAGYILCPECLSEKDIQQYRFLYKRDDNKIVRYREGQQPPVHSGEEICTFDGKRLKTCRVFFAVKENIDEIRRIDFPLPGEDFTSMGGRSFEQVKDEYARYVGLNKKWDDLSRSQKNLALRDNEYGTSIISIQFPKTGKQVVSIKNRYNHHLPFGINPDATFGNNLDNIIMGLRSSFNESFQLDVKYDPLADFQLPNYVLANDGKRYRYNSKMDAVYYCESNVIIDHGEVVKFDPERYLVLDNGNVIDLKEKSGFIYKQHGLSDSLCKTFPKNCKIDVSVDKKTGSKTVSFISKGKDDIKLTLDKHNSIIEIEDPNLIESPVAYCSCAQKIQKAKFQRLERMKGKSFDHALNLESFDAPNLESMGNYCFQNTQLLQKIMLPKLAIVGNYCFQSAVGLKKAIFPNLLKMGNECFCDAEVFSEAYFPKAEKVGNYCFACVNSLNKMNFNDLKQIGDMSFYALNALKVAYMPSLEKMGDSCFTGIDSLEVVCMPKLNSMGYKCFYYGNKLKKVYMNSLEKRDHDCFTIVSKLQELEMPYDIRENLAVQSKIEKLFNHILRHTNGENLLEDSQLEVDSSFQSICNQNDDSSDESFDYVDSEEKFDELKKQGEISQILHRNKEQQGVNDKKEEFQEVQFEDNFEK